MITRSITAPPPPPAGQDLRELRTWCINLQQSVQSCVSALRTLQPPVRTSIAPRDEGGGSNERDHSFKFTPDYETGATGGIITEGYCFVGGVLKTISSTPASWELSNVTTSTKYWVAVTYSTATAAWTSGASWPTSTAAIECFRILEITCTDSVITSFIQRRCSDIHAGVGTSDVDVFTSLSYSTSTHKLTYGKKTLTVIAAGSESTGQDFTGNQFEVET